MSRVPTKGIDYTSKDYESFRNDMIKQLRIKMPEYTDLRQSDAGIVILELLAQGLDILSYYQDVLANETLLTTAEQRSSVLKWCKILGYTPKASTPSEFTQVFVLISEQDTDTTIPAGTKVKTQASANESEVYFETASDLVIPAGKLGNEMQDGKYVYTVKVVQGVSIAGELVGSSNGSKDQSFSLNYTPAILDSISVLINEGFGFEKWEKVDNFTDSTATSRVYTVSTNDKDEAVITFGDGVFGKIPSVYKDGIFCDYRVGGGEQGNVGAMKICILDSNIALVAETFNPDTSDSEGHDKESIEDIKMNVSTSYKTVWGALTEEDFAGVIVTNFSYVDKAISYATGERLRDVDIYVLLKNDSPLTESIKQEMLDIFDENKGGRKLIGSGDISIIPAIKTPVDITATLAVKDRYNFEEVKSKVTAFLEDYFSVGNYDFETELSFPSLSSEVMNPANAIDGILFFKITSPNIDVATPEKGVIYTLGNLNIVNGGA